MSTDTHTIQILGAYGTKYNGFGTTAFLLNGNTTIDAGTLLKPLKEESAKIERIWLTHSHLDHISDIAYVLDDYYSKRESTLRIYGLPETIDALKEHFFNDLIWPDFSRIPLANGGGCCIEYHTTAFNNQYALGDDEYIMPFQTDHTVASSGYVYTKHKRSILITADTYDLANAFEIIENNSEIKAIVLECSFPSSYEKLAKVSKHLTPKLLFGMLEGLKREDVQLYINHIKPLYLEKIVHEIEQYRGKWKPIILKDEDFITF